MTTLDAPFALPADAFVGSLPHVDLRRGNSGAAQRALSLSTRTTPHPWLPPYWAPLVTTMDWSPR